MHRAMIGLLFLVTSASGQNAKPNFSGTWKYEPSLMSRDQEIDRIDHKEPDFVISEKIGRQDVVYGFGFKTDGQELIDRNGNNEVSRKGRWQGNTIVLDTRFTGTAGVGTKHEEMSLSEDGKTMTRTVTYTGPSKWPDRHIVLQKISDGIRGITIGDTEAVVRHEWGDPVRVEHRGGKTIYIYDQQLGPYEVIFVGGKLINSMFRTFDKEAVGNVK